MQKLSDAFQIGARAVQGWERGWLTGSNRADGAPVGIESGEDPVHYSASPIPTSISRRGTGKAAIFVMLLVKYVCVYVCSPG